MVHRSQIVTLGVFAAGLALAGWCFFNHVAEGNPIAVGSPGELDGNTQFGQTFVASYADLYRIDVMMSTYGRHNTHDVVFHLKEDLTFQADLVSMTFSASQVRDKTWQSFTFPPISDSAGRSFYFFLESPTSEPGNAVTVMGKEGDPYLSGQGFINHHPASADMAFRIYHRMTMGQKVNMVLESLAANKPSIWGKGIFYLTLAVLYILLLGTLLYKTGSVEFLKGEEDDQ
jgi:hypothetical protein